MSAHASYLRFPTIRGELVAFVAEDDVWLVPAAGGRAWRLTADDAPVAFTRLSPDAARVAFTSRRDGPPEVCVADLDGGGARRLTYWGEGSTRVLGWLDADHVLAASAVRAHDGAATWAWSVPVAGDVPVRLPFGPVTGYAPGPGGALVLGVDQGRRGAASWKRYRGGDAGKLWVDPDGAGRFARLLTHLCGQLEDPTWVGDRLVLLSDHEGWGNVYSVALPAGATADGVDALAAPVDLRRHTDHGDAYARALGGDGDRLVYQCLGDLYVLDDLAPDGAPRRLDVLLGGPRTARRPRPVDAGRHLGEVAPDHTGRASALEVLGTVHWLTHRDGPVRALVDTPGVRARIPVVVPTAAPAPGAVGDRTRPVVVCVTDADGDDALEVVAAGSGPARRLAGGRLGRVLELAGSPDGRLAAVATHDGRLLVVDLTAPSGADGTGDGATDPVRVVVDDASTDVSGLAFSPDSRWLAWSHPGPREPLRHLRIADLRPPDGGPVTVDDATPLRFQDSDPVFTPDGKYLAFLSVRTFDPVYDALVFDMSFLAAQRPYLLPLAATTPSPFDPETGGRPVGDTDKDDKRAENGSARDSAQDSSDDAPGNDAAPAVAVDLDGLAARAVPVPVPAGRFRSLLAVKDALLWLDVPLTGELGEAHSPDAHTAATLRRYDLRKRTRTTLAEGVHEVRVSGDGKRLVVHDDDGLRVVPADRTVEPDDDTADAVAVDLGRVRVVSDPGATWRQMYAEQGRLMRDHFWVADMGGVDWAAALERYRPLVERAGSRDDLSEIIWEVVGELGSSHAYEVPPPRPVEAARRVGHLGADIARDDDGTWRLVRVVPGEPSVPSARSPLLAPGVAVGAGSALLAVDGRAVEPDAGPWPLLVGTAGRPVELRVRAADDAAPRAVVVVPLPDERALRYHDWVADRRAATHAATGGRVGYLHVPDMMAGGWAQLHRDLHGELARDALVLDLRANGGGHLSELVLEKLARRIRARSVNRYAPEETWPSIAPRGPLVALTDNRAGSDGDVGTAMFRALGLGPVVGTRTWGGVIGIDSRYSLVDGTSVTQPRYGFLDARGGLGHREPRRRPGRRGARPAGRLGPRRGPAARHRGPARARGARHGRAAAGPRPGDPPRPLSPDIAPSARGPLRHRARTARWGSGRSEGSRAGLLDRAQAHVLVDRLAVTQEGHALDAGREQVPPRLADPGLGVRLAREGRLGQALAVHDATVDRLVPPGPRAHARHRSWPPDPSGPHADVGTLAPVTPSATPARPAPAASPLLAGALLLGGAAAPWPVPGCGCVTCTASPAAAALGLAVGATLVLDGDGPPAAGAAHLATSPAAGAAAPTARELAIGDQVTAGGLRAVALPGPTGDPDAVAVVVSDGVAALLWSPGPGRLPPATLEALGGAALDVAVVDVRDAAGRAAATHAAHRLADLRRADALAPGTRVLAVGLDHRGPAADRVAADLAVHGITAARGGERPAVLDPARRSPAVRRTLVLGPASSGKSGVAEHLLAGRPEVVYAATGPGPDGDDAEWAAKVAAHRSRRPPGWTTVESAAAGALPALLTAAGPPVLLDSLGTWLTAVLDRAGAWEDAPVRRRGDVVTDAVEEEVAALVEAWRGTAREVVAVGEEVGWGIVPATRAGRVFAQALGGLTRRLAGQSERTVLVVAGRGLDLDPAVVEGAP